MSALPSHLEISNLLYRYAERIDDGDYAGLAELFADAVITQEGTGMETRGREDIQAMYETWTRRYADNGTPHTRHVTTNVIFDIDEEAGTASTRSYVVVFQRTDVLPLQPVITNRYHDRFRRVDGAWRWEHRHMLDFYNGDLSQHLLQPFDVGS